MNQLNIAVVGSVSAGKSSFINSLLAESKCAAHIKRTTFLPHVYHENNSLNNTTYDGKQLEQDYINNPSILTLKEIHYNIKQIQNFVKFNDNTSITLYDLPGLNDSKTSELYYTYLSNTFHKFDIVLWIIDVNSAINTSDERDICTKLVHNIKQNYDNHGIVTKLIILLNKCDEMSFVNGQLVLDNDIKIMSDQARGIINEIMTEFKYTVEFDLVPISSHNTYIYRKLQTDQLDSLETPFLNKLGYNEYPRIQWNSFTDDEKVSKIKNMFNKEVIQHRMMMTGFNEFKTIFQTKYIDMYQKIFYDNRLMSQLYQLCTNYTPNCNTDNGKYMIIVDITNIRNDLQFINQEIKQVFNKYLELVGSKFDNCVTETVNFNTISTVTEYNLCFEIKTFYQKINILLFNNTLSYLNYNRIEQLLYKYLINKLHYDNTLSVFDQVNIIKQLKEYKYPDWKKEIITACSSENVINQNIIELVATLRTSMEMELTDIIDIMFNILDKRYELDFKNRNFDKVICYTMFWDRVLLKSTNKYYKSIYNMKRILNKYLDVECEVLTFTSTYNCDFEQTIYSYINQVCPNEIKNTDDLFYIF